MGAPRHAERFPCATRRRDRHCADGPRAVARGGRGVYASAARQVAARNTRRARRLQHAATHDRAGDFRPREQSDRADFGAAARGDLRRVAGDHPVGRARTDRRMGRSDRSRSICRRRPRRTRGPCRRSCSAVANGTRRHARARSPRRRRPSRQDASAIGFGGFEEGGPGLKTLAVAARDGGPYIEADAYTVSSGRYPLTRYLYVRIAQTPGRPLRPPVREFLRYMLSRSAQEPILYSGYFPLTAAEAREELAKLH